MERLDYLVIGGGSGGLASARRAAAYGARVALLESGPLGGTCVNVGCVPKKIMWNAAEIAEELGVAQSYGFELTLRGLDFAALRKSREAYIARMRENYAANLAKDGVRVVFAGPPNAGKSSLINAIAGQERAIVTDIPGTTRDHIEVPLALGGVPILLTDTAGLRATEDKVEAIGVERAEGLIEAADVVVWLGEPGAAPPTKRLIRVHAKSDIRGSGSEGSLAVSATTGRGLKSLLERIAAEAVSVLPAIDAIALNRRQADCIAEAAAVLRDAAKAQELILVAEDLRAARGAFDRLTGRAGVEDVLDALFGRFCLGK